MSGFDRQEQEKIAASKVQSRNWFTGEGENYAQFRPVYPASVLEFLLDVVTERKVAVDVGCGTGQLTQLLSTSFDRVTGIDPSETQIANATPCCNADYRVAPAEELPDDLQNANLITVAQAAHWFNLPEFYREVTRIAAPEAIIALISYGVPEPDEKLRERFGHFYTSEIGSFWPPERHHVDEGYTGLFFPFTEISAPKIQICLEWNLSMFMGYLSTWSAVKRAAAAGQSHLLIRFYADVCKLWGEPEATRTFIWPVNIRAGKL